MSIHIELSEEAAQDLKKLRRNNLISAWMVSILTFILLTVIFILMKSYVFVEKTDIIISYPYTISNPPNDTPPSDPVTQEASMPAPPITTINTAVTTEVNLPTLEPSRETGEIGPPIIGIGLDSINISTPGARAETLFGDIEPGGSTLVGTFYDTKLTPGGKATNLSEKEFLKAVNTFISNGWNENVFGRFYKSPTKLYTSYFYIAKSYADSAPKAFKCPDNVKGSRWVAVYRGKVVPPVSGKFRFVGYADDALVVRFNGKNVFDYGFYQMAIQERTSQSEWQDFLRTGKGTADMKRQLKAGGINEAPMTFYKYSSAEHWNQTIGGMAAGQVFEVKEGVSYPIEVLISEIPGGSFGMTLLVQDMKDLNDPNAPKDKKTGAPILNLFRTDLSYPEKESKKPNSVPFLDASMVWPVETKQ